MGPFASLGKQKFEEYRGHWPSFVIHELAVPDRVLAVSFVEYLEPLLNRISASHREDEALAQIRDFLLPKLMSGEIRLRDAEKQVETMV